MQKTVLWSVLVLTVVLMIWAGAQRATASANQASSNQAPPPPAASASAPAQVTTRAYSFNNDVGLTELNDFLTKYPAARTVAVTVDPKMNRIILVVEIH